MNNDDAATLYTCPDCNGVGEREAFNFFLDATELRACATCHGDGTVDADPEALPVVCDACNGSGEGLSEGSHCRDCHGTGERREGDEEHDDFDDEPADLDSDAGYDPYTGGAEDDGYDTYGDDCGCDDF